MEIFKIYDIMALYTADFVPSHGPRRIADIIRTKGGTPYHGKETEQQKADL